MSDTLQPVFYSEVTPQRDRTLDQISHPCLIPSHIKNRSLYFAIYNSYDMVHIVSMEMSNYQLFISTMDGSTDGRLKTWRKNDKW